MMADWVAASVRARSMAQRRVGGGTSRALAAKPSLTAALSVLTESVYAQRLHGVAGLAAAERAIHETFLWQLRVLAGWLPASGTVLARTMAATYEIENVVALALQLDGGPTAPEPFRLGALATAWPRLALAGSAGDLAAVLRTTGWGDVGDGGPGRLRETLTVAWARKLSAVAPATQPWCDAVCVLAAAQGLTPHTRPAPQRLLHLLRPVLGRSWEDAGSISEFRDALPPRLRAVVRDIESPRELWRAEARAHSEIEKNGFRLLHDSMPGPDVVVGAMAVLSMDAWRVCAALAAAAVSAGASEVLDEAA